MGDIFGNIFEEEKDKQGDSNVSVKSSVTKSPQPSEGLFGDIFKDEPLDTARAAVSEAKQETKQGEDGFLKSLGKNIVSKTAGALKFTGQKALDLWAYQSEKNRKATLDLVNLQRSVPLQAALNKASTPEEKQAILNDPKMQKYKPYKSYDEYEQDIPLVKFFNSDAGKATVGFISDKTSNIPLKTAARIQSLGDKTYEEAYAAWIEERNNPDNPTWQKFLFELQDTGVQSGIGILLSVGTAALTRNAQAGYGVSGAYYTALSADEQIQNRGRVDSLGNIAIDVVGDSLINGALQSILKGGTKSTIVAALEGFGIEGSTEVTQSLLKYANDYGQANTDAERQAILDEAKQYVINGGMAMEFAVGGTVGGIAAGIAGGVSQPSSQPNDATTKKGGTPKQFVSPKDVPPAQSAVENVNIEEMRSNLVELEKTGDISDPIVQSEITRARDVLNDYASIYSDKTVYVPSTTGNTAPLVEVVTARFPDGKIAVKFSANTAQNGFSAEYDYSQLFNTQEEATKSAREAIVAWAQSQETTDIDEQADLAKIVDFVENPRAPITEEARSREPITEKTMSLAAARQLIPKEGGFANIKSRAARNAFAADELSGSFALNAKFLFETAQAQDVDLQAEMMKIDRIADSGERTAAALALVDRLTQGEQVEQKSEKKTEATTKKKGSTEPQKKKKADKKGETTTKKTAKRNPIKEVAGEKIPQRKAKAVYNKGTRLTKGDYKGGTYTTNTYILEFNDVEGIEPVVARDKAPTEEGIQTAIIDRLGDIEVSQPNRVIRNSLGATAVVVRAGDQNIAIDLAYYNYLVGKYPSADWKVSDRKGSPLGLYEGKKLVAVVMPFADTEGKTIENLKKDDDAELNTSFEAVAKNQGVDEALESVESKELKKRGYKLKNNNDPKEGYALGKKKVKDFKPSGVASAVFSSDEVQGGGQPEKGKADIPIELGQMDSINPIEMPELVALARELMGGQSVQVTKLRGGKGGGVKLGDFLPSAGGRIRLADFLFKQENLPQAAKTLAHEIGHLIDYLPDATLARGNLLGRLSSLRGFMQSTFSFEEGKGVPQKERTRIRNEARKEVAKELGKAQKDFTIAEKKKAKDLGTKRINEAINSGGFIRDAKVRKELLTVSRWWKPYNPETAPPQFKKYRESSVELYADAISVLFNAPRRLQDLAPTFYEGFFKGLDAKPEVRDAYFEVQALLSGDRELVIKKRREGVKKMFKDGDKDALDLHNQRAAERENRRKQYWSHFKHTVIDKNFQIIDRVKKAQKEGKTINPDENPVYFLEERNYLGGKIKAIFEREFNTIYSTLNENEITWDDFGEVLFYERIAAGDRSDVANPRGITPEAAQELLDTVKKEYGAERWAIIQEQVQKFRDANRKITEEAYQAGLYKKELYDQMQENPAYVTFQVLDHLEEGMNSRVYKSLGTLKDVTNPADATMLKVISTIRAAERNVTTKTTVDFLKANFADEIVEANYSRTPKGRFPLPSKLPNQELVTFMEEGVVKGYYVDPYIADTINNQSVGHNAPIVPVIRFMNTTLFRPLFISFNLGFQSFNLIRDFVRFYKNTPDMTFLRAFKRYGQAGRVARVRAFGLGKNPSQKDIEAFNFLNKMEEEKVLSTTYNDLIKGETTVDKQVEKILADTGIKEFQPKPTIEKVPKFAKPAVKVLNKAGILDVTSNILGFIENLGNLIETLPKAAGIIELTQDGDLTLEEKSFVRRKIGSPDFLAGGTYKPITNEVFLFSNAIIQGIRSDIEVATDPTSRSGWWWKTAKITFLPKLLMMAVLYGALGDDFKELMEGASEYDRTNYIILPLGRDSNGKPIYVRVPQDETSRFLGGIFWKALTFASNERNIGQDLMDVMSYTGGQLPSISPAIESISATVQFASGQNPYDFFRGRPALSETTFKAGGLPATKAFLGWQFQQLGGGIFYRFYHEPSAQREEGNVEKFFNAPIIGNVLGRFVRVSDYGETEKLKNIQKQVEKEKAQQTLKDRELINKYIDQAREQNIRFSTATLENQLILEKFGGVPITKDEKAEAQSLVKKFQLTLRRGNADPQVSALVTAGSNDAKLAILKEIKKDMSDAEFQALQRDLISSKIVSKEVFNDLIREGNE